NRGLKGLIATAFAFDPLGNQDFVGTTDGVYQGTAKGAWAPAGSGFPAHDEVFSVAVDPLDGHFLYAATRDGIYDSTDEGSHWVQSNAQYTTGPIVIDPHSDEIFAVQSAVGGGSGDILTSVDHGLTWMALSAAYTT